jgi:hypothetical protein
VTRTSSVIAVAAPDAPPIVRPCATRAESGLFVRRISPLYKRRSIRAGPLVLIAGEYAAMPRAEFRAVPGRPGRYYPQKTLLLARAGSVVTLSVPRAERRHVALTYRPSDWKVPYARGYRLQDGEASVMFRACAASEPSFVLGRKRPVGRWTEFNGGFIVAGARCVTLHVRAGRRLVPVRLSFGAGRCRR